MLQNIKLTKADSDMISLINWNFVHSKHSSLVVYFVQHTT